MCEPTTGRRYRDGVARWRPGRTLWMMSLEADCFSFVSDCYQRRRGFVEACAAAVEGCL